MTKTREMVKAGRVLERVYMDLCGPMFITSCSGRVYSMDVIDTVTSLDTPVRDVPNRSEPRSVQQLPVINAGDAPT